MTDADGGRPTRVIVGVDGSVAASHALAWAQAEAAVHDIEVLAVHAWDVPPPVTELSAMVETDPAPYEAAAAEVMSDVLTHAPSGPPVTSVLVRGHPSRALLDLQTPGDLLVVGSRGRGGFAGLLLGSVSQHCATHARGPVAVVPPTAALPPERDVVVGIDGSDGARAALRWAAGEARARGAVLSLVNAWWQPLVVSPLGEPVGLQQHVDLRPNSLRLLREAMGWIDTEVAASLHLELLPDESPAAPALLECAKGAGLLVVGSRGRGGFAGLLLGSVSQHCVRHATCAVVVVPSA